jgi:hypothetical protein
VPSTANEPEQPTSKGAPYQCRRFAFTSYAEEWPEYLEDKMNYLVAGRETCPKTGRLHWQGYVELRRKTTIAGLKRFGGSWATCHLETARSDGSKNTTYCLKSCGENWISYGEPMAQGERTDLNDTASKLLSGETSIDSILENTPLVYHQYGRTLLALDELRAKKRPEATSPRKDLKVYWIHGPPGCGKTRWAWEQILKAPSFYEVPDDGGWMDLYNGQHTLFIDEIRQNTFKFPILLKLLDIHPYTVRRRNRPPFPACWRQVFITSDIPPAEMFPSSIFGNEDQLLRRLTKVYDAKNFLSVYQFKD